jgi:hypothetical protein
MINKRPKILKEMQRAIEQTTLDEVALPAQYMTDVQRDILTINEAAEFIGCSVPSMRTYMTPQSGLELKIAHLGGKITPVAIGADRTSPWEKGKEAPLFYVVTRRMMVDFQTAYEDDFPIEIWQDELDQILTIEDAVEMFDVSLHRMRQAIRNNELPAKKTKRPLLLISDVANFKDNMPVKPYAPGSRAKLTKPLVIELRKMAHEGETLSGLQLHLENRYEIEIDRSALSRMLRGLTYAGINDPI